MVSVAIRRLRFDVIEPILMGMTLLHSFGWKICDEQKLAVILHNVSWHLGGMNFYIIRFHTEGKS